MKNSIESELATLDRMSTGDLSICGCHACRYRLAQERQRPCWLKNQQARAKKRSHSLGIRCESGHWEI